MNPIVGKYIIIIGLAVVLIGLIVFFFGGTLHWFGRLPGDIRIEGKNGTFYFPIVTGLLVSLLVNLIIALIQRFFS